MKVIVAIPCYNCAPQLPRVLDGITAQLAADVAEIWVVDNGSTDNTVAVATEYRQGGRLPNLRVFQNHNNVNLGGTHKTVFNKASVLGATHVVIVHGDDQARSAEIADLLRVAREGGAETVLGSRFSKTSRLHGYDWKRVAGNRALNVLYSTVAGRKLVDLGSGLNLFALSDLDRSRYMTFGDKLSFNYELILDLVRRKVAFQYLPITWSETDQVSNARNVSIFTEALRILARWRLGRPTSNFRQPTEASYDWDEVR